MGEKFVKVTGSVTTHAHIAWLDHQNVQQY